MAFDKNAHPLSPILLPAQLVIFYPIEELANYAMTLEINKYTLKHLYYSDLYSWRLTYIDLLHCSFSFLLSVFTNFFNNLMNIVELNALICFDIEQYTDLIEVDD